jgi:RNase H-fold protein (predicted Holliday junction resolvase)
MRSLGLDVGDKRIGVALSDPRGMLARPLTTIERRGDTQTIEAIIKIVEQILPACSNRLIHSVPTSHPGKKRVRANTSYVPIYDSLRTHINPLLYLSIKREMFFLKRFEKYTSVSRTVSRSKEWNS